MLSALKLIVGLGNPGSQYSVTRHNVGFWFVDSLASSHHLTFKTEAKFSAEVCRLQTNTIDCWFCKPMTFMNQSGTALQAMARFYKIPLQGILVVHDELDLPAGVARLKDGGGHGGHNGLRDVISQMGGKTFIRLRLGIGRSADSDNTVSYVLSKPASNDAQLIKESIQSSLDVMPLVFAKDMQKAMDILHQKPASKTATI